MSERKPGGMKWETWIDRQIRQAEAEGEFENLPGRGKPDPNLGSERDPAWWAKGLMRREGLSYLPPALEIRRTLEREMEAIEGDRTEAQVRARVQRLNERIRILNAKPAVGGPATSVAPIDEDAVVARWRARD